MIEIKEEEIKIKGNARSLTVDICAGINYLYRTFKEDDKKKFKTILKFVVKEDVVFDKAEELVSFLNDNRIELAKAKRREEIENRF